MSEEIHFLRVKTLSMETTRSNSHGEVLRRVMRHNLREIQSEFGERSGSVIDPRRIRFNEILFGLDTSDGVAEVAHEAMLTEKVRPRVNAALGIEIVCSLPNGLKIDYRAYFKDAAQWAEKYFDVPMLSTVIHNDEDYSHVHIVMLPMREGKLMGRNLLGDIPKQNAMHNSFNAEVGKRYGLKAPKQAKRYSAEVRHIAMQTAREYMRDNSGFTDATVDALIKILAKDPSATMAALGLPMPTEPSQTVAGIFTRDCGRDSAIALCDDDRKSAIAFRSDDESDRDCGQNHKRYALIALSNSPPSFPPPNGPQQATQDQSPAPAIALTDSASIRSKEIEPSSVTSTASSKETATDPQPTDTEGDYTRVRDNEQPTKQWSDELGEFIMLPVKQSAKRAATSLVRLALASKNGLVCSGPS